MIEPRPGRKVSRPPKPCPGANSLNRLSRENDRHLVRQAADQQDLSPETVSRTSSLLLLIIGMKFGLRNADEPRARWDWLAPIAAAGRSSGHFPDSRLSDVPMPRPASIRRPVHRGAAEGDGGSAPPSSVDVGCHRAAGLSQAPSNFHRTEGSSHLGWTSAHAAGQRRKGPACARPPATSNQSPLNIEPI